MPVNAPKASTTTSKVATMRDSPQRFKRVTAGSSKNPSSTARASGIRMSRPKYSAAMMTLAISRPMSQRNPGNTAASACKLAPPSRGRRVDDRRSSTGAGGTGAATLSALAAAFAAAWDEEDNGRRSVMAVHKIGVPSIAPLPPLQLSSFYAKPRLPM